MQRIKTRRNVISNGWRVKELQSRGTSEASDLSWLPAVVPGHVHLDLIRAGVIQDPFYRMAERSAAWVDGTDWVYETTFSLPDEPADLVYLHFDGLDTVAEVTLNGEVIGETDNMFIPHEFSVRDRLCHGKGTYGENTLRVVFRSALREGRERQQAWDGCGNDTLPPQWFSWGPRSFIRKAQYMYGWDWGPELISCGIWRPVSLVEVPIARLLDWKYDVTFLPDGAARVDLELFVERSPGSSHEPLTVRASVLAVGSDEIELDDVVPAPAAAPVPDGVGRLSATVSLIIENPRLWWPNRSDEDVLSHPLLYSVQIALHTDRLVDERDVKIGLRTVELIQDPDDDGETFKFRVNGRDLFIKGANWIPADSFPSRLMNEPEGTNPGWNHRDSRVEQLINLCCAAGFNMLRIWGGGLYESEHFYELCDQHGILVWQDFPFGCAYYPDTGKYAESVRVEAVEAARRLRSHTSLAIWCGNNENHQMHHDGWVGADNRPPRLLGERLYHDILPAVLAAEDPGRAYWPSSPWGGENPNDQNTGDRHDWDVWHGRGDWKYYVEDNSRFVSEFGFAASCGLAAWDRCLAEEDRWPRSPAVRWHDKTRKGYETYLGFIALHFPEPQTLEDLVYYSQINQAEALKCGLEHWRRNKGRCWGLLFWQINDCWPVQSWAVIDSEGQPRAGYYAVKKAYAPVLLSLVREEDRIVAHLTNDLNIALAGSVSLAVRTFEGETLLEEHTPADVAANGAAMVAELEIASVEGLERSVFVDARFQPHLPAEDANSTTGWYSSAENILFLAEPKDLALASPNLTIELIEQYHNVCVDVSADRFAAYVWLRLHGEGNWDDVEVRSDNFFHLRAGETRRVWLASGPEVTAAGIRGRLSVRSL